jgi:hypothetical protein
MLVYLLIEEFTDPFDVVTRVTTDSQEAKTWVNEPLPEFTSYMCRRVDVFDLQTGLQIHSFHKTT